MERYIEAVATMEQGAGSISSSATSRVELSGSIAKLSHAIEPPCL